MRISFSILAFTSFLALTKAASVEDKIETVALPPKVQVVKADLQKAAQDSIKREVSEVSERYGGYDYEYQRCASQNEDTLCSPSNAYTLGRTFDLLFKGKDGYYQVSILFLLFLAASSFTRSCPSPPLPSLPRSPSTKMLIQSPLANLPNSVYLH